MFYTILSGQQAFENENVSKLISMITLGDYSVKEPVWDKVSAEAKDLLHTLL